MSFATIKWWSYATIRQRGCKHSTTKHNIWWCFRLKIQTSKVQVESSSVILSQAAPDSLFSKNSASFFQFSANVSEDLISDVHLHIHVWLKMNQCFKCLLHEVNIDPNFFFPAINTPQTYTQIEYSRVFFNLNSNPSFSCFCKSPHKKFP